MNFLPLGKFTNSLPRPLPLPLRIRLRALGRLPTQWVLHVSIRTQQLRILQRCRVSRTGPADYQVAKRCRISTSRFGVGQIADSYQTPLGLHRIAEKIGLGHPVGSVFAGRKCIGLNWQGMPNASIVHRILWLEGLEPGFNRGGNVDSQRRYIYIHGFSDETTLGRPASRGCVHMSARDLVPLSEMVPRGTLVWIAPTFVDGRHR